MKTKVSRLPLEKLSFKNGGELKTVRNNKDWEILLLSGLAYKKYIHTLTHTHRAVCVYMYMHTYIFEQVKKSENESNSNPYKQMKSIGKRNKVSNYIIVYFLHYLFK